MIQFLILKSRLSSPILDINVARERHIIVVLTMRCAKAILLCLSLQQASSFVPTSTSWRQIRYEVPTRDAFARQSRVERTSCSMTVPQVPFRKYQGLGNDFILVDNRQAEEPVLTPEQSAHLCNR